MPAYRRRRLPWLARRMIRQELGVGRRSTLRILRAHRLLNRGRTARAAELFSEEAAAVEQMGQPAAPMLYIESGRAQLRSGQRDLAAESYRRGLELLIAAGRTDRLQSLGRLAVSELQLAGIKQLAEDYGDMVERAISESGPSTMLQPAVHAAQLPSKCPYCGGNVRSAEVDWLAPDEPACAYCGSPLIRER